METVTADKSVSANIAAMLHVHGALLAALCGSHPRPAELDAAFTFHLETVDAVLQTDSMRGLVSQWASTYRRHILTTSAGDPKA